MINILIFFKCILQCVVSRILLSFECLIDLLQYIDVFVASIFEKLVIVWGVFTVLHMGKQNLAFYITPKKIINSCLLPYSSAF